jgi:uncharacterized membrane protein
MSMEREKTMTEAEWYEWHGITRGRWNDLTLTDKRFPWSWHIGLIVFLVLLTMVAYLASYTCHPTSMTARVTSGLAILLPGVTAFFIALCLIPRVALVVWWYLTMRAQDDLKAALARRRERFLQKRLIKRMTPRDFEDDGPR